jgi:hypothetical protein
LVDFDRRARARAASRSIRFSRARPAAALAAVVALPLATAADPHTPDDSREAVEEILVTGTRTVTASSTLTVPAEDFELRPLESGGQMIEAVPGALTAQHTGGGKAEQYFLRGFDADHGTDLAVYFDDVPVNLRSHAHGQGFLDLHFVTKETIDRLDVAKGPYSPRFGDFATAAAIEYTPSEKVDESLVKLEIGEWASYRAVAVASPRFGPFEGADPAANGLISFEAFHTDGPFRDDEDLWRFSAFARGDVRLTPSLLLSGHVLGYGADWDASGLIPERLVDAGSLGRFGSLDPTEGGDSTRIQGKLQLDWEPSEHSRVVANTYVAYYDLDLYSNFTYALRDPAAGDGIVQRDDRIYTGGRIEARHAVETPWPGGVRAGLEWRYDDARVRLGRQTQRRVTDIASDDDLRELSLGPYVEIELLPLRWIRFLGGLRFEHVSFEVESRLPGAPDGDGDDHIWLPKANLVASPFASDAPFESDLEALRHLDLFLNFGVGFHSNDVRTGVVGSDLLARAQGAEIGAHTHLWNRVSVSLAGFWIEIEDELVFVGDEGSTEPAGRTRRLGVEFATYAALTDWLYLRGDVAYTDARFTTNDDPIPQAPRLIAKGAAGVHLGGFAAELSVRSLGDRYASESFRNPKLTGYTVLDLGARYRHGPFELGLAVENLTDTEWRASEFYYESCARSEVGAIAECPNAGGGTGVGDLHFTPGNPRNVRGWIRYAF